MPASRSPPPSSSPCASGPCTAIASTSAGNRRRTASATRSATVHRRSSRPRSTPACSPTGPPSVRGCGARRLTLRRGAGRATALGGAPRPVGTSRKMWISRPPARCTYVRYAGHSVTSSCHSRSRSAPEASSARTGDPPALHVHLGGRIGEQVHRPAGLVGLPPVGADHHVRVAVGHVEQRIAARLAGAAAGGGDDQGRDAARARPPGPG